MLGVLSFLGGPIGRWLIIALIGAALFGFGWVRGNEHGTAKLSEYIGKQAEEAVRIVTKRGEITVQVITKYVKVQAKTADVAKAVDEGVKEYAKRNRGFTLDTEFRSLHDRAALNALPGATARADVARGAPAAAEVLAGVTSNYAACHRTADRLDGLQDWVREQEKVK